MCCILAVKQGLPLQGNTHAGEMPAPNYANRGNNEGVTVNELLTRPDLSVA